MKAKSTSGVARSEGAATDATQPHLRAPPGYVVGLDVVFFEVEEANCFLFCTKSTNFSD